MADYDEFPAGKVASQEEVVPYPRGIYRKVRMDGTKCYSGFYLKVKGVEKKLEFVGWEDARNRAPAWPVCDQFELYNLRETRYEGPDKVVIVREPIGNRRWPHPVYDDADLQARLAKVVGHPLDAAGVQSLHGFTLEYVRWDDSRATEEHKASWRADQLTHRRGRFAFAPEALVEVAQKFGAEFQRRMLECEEWNQYCGRCAVGPVTPRRQGMIP